MGREAPSGGCDGEGVLGVVSAGFDAFVAEDAAFVVPHVELVLDLGRLSDCRHLAGIAHPLGPGSVVVHPVGDLFVGPVHGH